MRRLCAVIIVACSLLVLAPQARADDVEQVSLVAPLPLTPEQGAAAYWYWLHTLDPQTLIRAIFAETPVAENMVRIASRETGGTFNCAAANRRSSARGLFQTLKIHQPRATRLGLSWTDIAGPDCVSDALLAFDLWREQGLRPWRMTR